MSQEASLPGVWSPPVQHLLPLQGAPGAPWRMSGRGNSLLETGSVHLHSALQVYRQGELIQNYELKNNLLIASIRDA